MVCEFYNYQILELSTRKTQEEKRDYLKQLCDSLMKKEKERIKKLIDEDSSNNYSVPKSINLFKAKLKTNIDKIERGKLK